jgi:YidC/Oxa1 family membrane protein insertase
VTLDPLYRIIGWLLALFYIPFHNIGIAIILLTIVIMLVQFPLTAKQARSMIQMQRVQPEIKKIQQKYKDDKAKQNEELLKFYQENKINPLAGCLPMVITIPIGIAVFRTFAHGLQRHLPKTGRMGELYHGICGTAATTAKCTADLSAQAKDGHAPQALHFLGVTVNQTAHGAQTFGGISAAIPYYVLIALVAFTGWYQVRQTQARQLQSGNTPPNAQMAAMTKIFPVFFAFICFGLNAGATLYFVVSNAWRIGQQHLVIGKLYDQAVTTGQLKPGAADDDPPPKDSANESNGKSPPGGNGKGGASKGQKPTTGKPNAGKPETSNGDANGKGQNLTPGQRRKKRKR